ncbi:MAG: thioredoxin-disulfide reductase [Dermabacter sp.]|nr:thioredoxin-disulfide reductase [Dermabacter sp.]
MSTTETNPSILTTVGSGGFGIDLNAPSPEPDAAATATSDTVHDLVIVGSGPAGYTAAVYAARAELAPVVIAGSLEAGGALMTTTEVENFPGFPEGIMGPELMTQMQEQAERFGAEIIFEDATAVDLAGDIKTIEIESGQVFRARAVILATGSAYRKLGIDGEERLSGKGVSWCATCDGFFFKDKDIVVVGGGDSAVEEATFLTRFANSVTLLHRRDALRASKIMAKRAEADPKLTIRWNSAIAAIHGDTQLDSLTVVDTQTGVEERLVAEGLFEAIGHIPRSALFADQVTLDDEGYVVCEGRTTHTSLPGVFACGDLVDHRYRQAITAAGSGCSAALDAEKFLAGLSD